MNLPPLGKANNLMNNHSSCSSDDCRLNPRIVQPRICQFIVATLRFERIIYFVTLTCSGFFVLQMFSLQVCTQFPQSKKIISIHHQLKQCFPHHNNLQVKTILISPWTFGQLSALPCYQPLASKKSLPI